MLLAIILLQLGYFLWKSLSEKNEVVGLKVDHKMQAQIDELKKKALQKDTIKIYPFNPNFITDYKGYTIGMSVDEIDRLHNFRNTEKYVNSAKEFQIVTKISDSLLNAISPYFKFPEWTQKSKQYSSRKPSYIDTESSSPSEELVEDISDLNSATAEDLRSINGIGEKLSARIIKFRDRLGGFLVNEQLYDVYGLEPEVVERTLKRFKVINRPKIEKININSASAETLSNLIYIQKDVAHNIVGYRNANGRIDSFEELSQIENFPSTKIERIALYLSL